MFDKNQRTWWPKRINEIYSSILIAAIDRLDIQEDVRINGLYVFTNSDSNPALALNTEVDYTLTMNSVGELC